MLVPVPVPVFVLVLRMALAPRPFVLRAVFVFGTLVFGTLVLGPVLVQRFTFLHVLFHFARDLNNKCTSRFNHLYSNIYFCWWVSKMHFVYFVLATSTLQLY